MSCCCSDRKIGGQAQEECLCKQSGSIHTNDSDPHANISPEASAVLYDGLALHAQKESGVCACVNACLVALNHKHTVLHTCIRLPLLSMVCMSSIVLHSATSSHAAA